MSTIITGNNHNYTSAEIIDVNGGEIIRQPTATSADNFAFSASSLLLGAFGILSSSYDGNSMTVTIQNDSTFVITQTCTGSGVTMEPSTSVVLPQRSSSTFAFLQEDAGTSYSVVIQDLTYTSVINQAGITIEYVNAAGPTVGVIGTAITVTFATGTQTATQLKTLIDGTPAAAALVTIVISGVGSNAQTSPTGPTSLVGGTPALVTVDIVNSQALFAPLSSTDNAIVRFDGTSGNVTQNSTVLVNDNGQVVLFENLGTGPDSVTLAAPTAVTASWTLQFPPDSGTSGYVLQTNGSGVTTWVSNNPGGDALFYAYGPAAAVTVTGTFTTVVLNTNPIIDSPTYYTYNTGTGVLTVVTTGIYEIAYTAQFQSLDNTGGADCSLGVQLLQNAGVVAGSITECWLTEVNGALKRPSASKNILVSVTAADTLAVQIARTAGTTTAQTRATQCTLMVTKLR